MIFTSMTLSAEKLFIIASTLDFIGSLVIALIVLSVHMHILKERKIDADVLRSMKKERVLVYGGILLIAFSAFIEVAVRM